MSVLIALISISAIVIFSMWYASNITAAGFGLKDDDDDEDENIVHNY